MLAKKKKLEKDLIRNVTILRGVTRAGCKIKTCNYRKKRSNYISEVKENSVAKLNYSNVSLFFYLDFHIS